MTPDKTVARFLGVAAAFAVAAIAASFLWYVSVLWSPSGYGDFGVTAGDFALPADDRSWIVTSTIDGFPAEMAGIKLGDRISTALPVHERLTVTGQIAPRPGEEVTLEVFHGKVGDTLTLKARALGPLSVTERVYRALQIVASIIFVVAGFVLVLLRPNRMTWGFYLFAVAVPSAILPHSTLYPVSYLPTEWVVTLGVLDDIITGAGIVGFLIFCLRFPADAPTGWRRRIDDVTPYLMIGLAAISVSTDLGRWFFIIPAGVTRALWNVWLVSCMATAIGGPVILLGAYFEARGAERARLKWVILGLICTSAALAGIILSWGGPLAGLPIIFVWTLSLLTAAFPLAVAYAVIRHRVIDVRFVISRSLAAGVVAAIVGLIVIGVDWLFTTKLPASRFETATYFGIAFFIGLTISAVRGRISRAIDFLFFRQQLVVRASVDGVAAKIRHASFKEDLYKPLTAGVAHAFRLASVALFERATDGGFGRVAAYGWPTGTLWNILLDDPLALRADARPRVTEIDSLAWPERRLPSGIARPVIMVPIIVRRRMAALLLCGAHPNGAALNPDETRWIRGLAADAALVYAASTTPNWDQGVFSPEFRRVVT